MDKKLKAYIDYIEKEEKKPSAELIQYHKDITAQFQHERLIHLIVTMFFALFMLIMFIFTIVAGFVLPESMKILYWCLGGLTLALLVTVIFYVRHYYLLENGTQRLEDVTRRLYKRDFWNKK
jgi:fatty-acid desaturase